MFKDVLKQLRDKKGLSQSQLADEIGVTAGAIGNYEQGTRLPKDDKTWIRIANYFNVTIDYLMDADNIEHKSVNGLKANPSISQTIQLPILGEVAAGIGEYADNNIIGYEDVPRSWVRGNDDYVFLRVHGDSMVPKFEENDLLLVRVQTSVDSGDYAIAIVDDENGVVKRVMYGKDWIELQSQNPMYAPRRFEGADVLRIRIFGLVKKSIRDY